MEKQLHETKGIREDFKLSEARIKEILNNPPSIMIRPEAVVFSRMSERAFRNAVNKGLIPEIRIGRRRMYRRDALLAAMKKLETGVIL